MEKFKNFLFKRKKEEKEEKEEKVYIERETNTLLEILNKLGGLNNIDIRRLIRYFDEHYKNKFIRLNNNGFIDEFKVLRIFFTMEMLDNVNHISINFYKTNSNYYQISESTTITILTEKKDYNPNDPFEEEDWDS